MGKTKSNAMETLRDYYREMEKHNGRSVAIELTAEFFGYEEDEVAEWTQDIEDT